MAASKKPKQKDLLVSREFALFQQNLRTTAFGIRFGKTLFENPDKLTPKQITTAMRHLGMNIPREVELGAEVAQAWTTGATLVDSYQTYNNVQNAQNLRSLGNATAATVGVATSLAQDLGMIDDQSASMLRVGTSLFLIISSSGANVMAWISLCTEIFGASQSAKATAEMMSKKAAYDWYSTNVTQQAWALGEHLKDLNSGKIGIFEFLSQAADDGSLIFENAIKNNPDFQKLFPNLKFFPVVDRSYEFSSSVTTWYGDSQSGDFTFNWRQLYDMDENEARQMIFNYVFRPAIQSYVNAEYTFREKGKASLNDAAILACMSRTGRFDSKTNYEEMFLKHMLTPSNIGDDSTFENMPNTLKQKAFSFSAKKPLTKEQMISFDKYGQIESLLADPTAKRHLKNKYSFDLQVVGQEQYDKMGFNWKNVSNYIAMLDIIDLVGNEQQFMETAQKVMGPIAFELVPKVNDFKQRFKDIQNISLIKKINTMAMGNVGYFMNASPEKIVKVNGSDIGPGIFRVKK